MKARHAFLFAAVMIATSISTIGWAQTPNPANSTIASQLIIEPPTLMALGFEWPIEGDANRNASVQIKYRKQGDTQ